MNSAASRRARDRRDAARAGRRRAARRPRVVPPRDAPRGADGDALGRARCARAMRQSPGRRRDVPPRVVPRGPGAAAHAAREDRLRDGRGQDDVRADRREGLGLPRRRDPAGRAGDRAAARSRARAGLERRRLDGRAHHRRARGCRGRRAEPPARRGLRQATRRRTGCRVRRRGRPSRLPPTRPGGRGERRTPSTEARKKAARPARRRTAQETDGKAQG